ncbi:MAG: hypothetical protein HRU41_33515 [Saprospiraceae bacterium]|nr:hypothetical protein [Saprospiraceae bacterium]
MNLSEEQIKAILENTQTELPFSLQLEDSIVDEIRQLKSYDRLIARNKRKARISLWVSLGTTLCLIVSLLYSLISSTPPAALGLQSLLPTFMVIVMLFMLHQLLYFSQNLEKKVNA